MLLQNTVVPEFLRQTCNLYHGHAQYLYEKFPQLVTTLTYWDIYPLCSDNYTIKCGKSTGKPMILEVHLL
jgi:hypothetical protein